MTLPDEDPIAQRAREVFDDACAHLDAGTANRLRLARRAALSDAPARAWRLAPIGGAVAIALAVAAVLVARRVPPAEPAPVAVEPAPVAAPAPAPTPTPAPVEVPQSPPSPQAPAVAREEAMTDEFAGDELAWDELEQEEDAELYAWLADAPVAPDGGEEAL